MDLQQGVQSSIEEDSSWSSVATRHSKISRLTSGYGPRDIRLSHQNPSTTPKKSTPAKIGQDMPPGTDSRKDDRFILSQGTLSSISCTQTAKTCDLPVRKKSSKVKRHEVLKPVVTPLGPNQSSSCKAKKKDLVSPGPLKETPLQRPRRPIALDALLGSEASASAGDTKYDSPLPQNDYKSAPVREIRTVVDDVCPSPLTAASVIRGTNSALRRGKTSRTTGPSMTSTTSTSKRGTKMANNAAEKFTVSRRSRSRHKMTYSKRPRVAKDISMIIHNDLDFMSDS